MEEDDDDNWQGDDAILFHQRRILELNYDNNLVDNDIENRTKGINKFGIQSFNSLSKFEDNLVINPLNLFSTILVLYVGSNGETLTELREFLQLGDLSDDSILSTVQTAIQLASSERYKMKTNYLYFNAIRALIDKRADISKKFFIWTKRYFNLEISQIDFEIDYHLISDQINQSIQFDLNVKEVGGLDTTIESRTQLVIMSSVRFKSEWFVAFPSDKITEEDFFNDGVTKVKVKMMSILNNSWNVSFHSELDSYAIEIPMSGKGLVFILILPKNKKGISRVCKELSFDILEKMLRVSHTRQCDLFLPQFTLDYGFDYSTNELCSRLKVFTDESEMREMAPNMRIKANNVLHKVVFEIDRTGFTGDYTKGKDADRFRVMRADHPFIFIVKDVRTQTFLFIGKVTKLETNINENTDRNDSSIQ